MNTDYDAIVVGARCAGSTTGMLLARQGHRVLIVDRATFPSDTLSTHVVHPPGVAALDRWGLLDRVVASGCPPIETYSFDFGHFTIAGRPRAVGGHSAAYAPRRTVLDQILVDAAREAGAEVREGFNVDEVLMENGAAVGVRGHGDGPQERLTARIVIGADGRNSRVAKTVGSIAYDEKPRLQWSHYAYFRDLPVDGFETYIRPDRGFAAAPTNDGLTMLVVGWPYRESGAYKSDIEGNYLATLELVPEFAARVRKAERVSDFLGGAVPNFFRTPYGAGWALVGDAGYTKDPLTAQGISDAFRDAEQCSAAVDAWLRGTRSYDAAMAAWQRRRDEEAGPMYEFTTQLATLAPPPPEMQQLLGAIAGNPAAMDAFVSVNAGTLSPAAFFAPDSIGAMLGAGVSG
jgi:2-polyprenyl-6-methoxyphenol hydroxylase-like FAD-dependent oxidoreductase